MDTGCVCTTMRLPALKTKDRELTHRRRALFAGRQQLGFKLRDFGFQAFETSAGAGQYHHLAVEFFAADQIQFAEATLQQGFELAFDFVTWLRRFATEQTGGLATQGVEKVFGSEHG